MATSTGKTVYLKSALLNAWFTGVAFTFPTTTYLGLLVCNFNSGAASPGYWATGIAVTTGTYVSPTTPNGHIYVCTTAGTTGSTEPTWPTGVGSTVTDGSTLVWTEATEYLLGINTTYPPVEVSGGGYARSPSAGLAQGTTDWTSAAASPDNMGYQTSNAVAITYPAATANWGLVVGWELFTASTGGDGLYVGLLTTYQNVVSGNTGSVPIGDLIVEEI